MNEFIESIRANLDTWGELTRGGFECYFIVVYHPWCYTLCCKKYTGKDVSMPGDHPLAYLFQKNVWRLADCCS